MAHGIYILVHWKCLRVHLMHIEEQYKLKTAQEAKSHQIIFLCLLFGGPYIAQLQTVLDME